MKDTIVISVLAIIAIMIARPALAALDSWQERMLFSPTPAQLELEQSRDRIMIYHGLKDVQVAQAMEQQFNRIDYMMFTGTVITDSRREAVIDPETGSARVEDDGC